MNWRKVIKKSNFSVKFLSTSSAGAPECAYDNLTITSAYSQGAVTYCGTDTPGDLRLKDLITIKFKTDRWMQKKGFIFMYKNEGNLP